MRRLLLLGAMSLWVSGGALPGRAQGIAPGQPLPDETQLDSTFTIPGTSRQTQPPAPSLGFNAQPAPRPAVPETQPARRNYADELTDFGVPPQRQMQRNVGSPTPISIPGGHVITTAEIRQAVGSSLLLVDVLEGEHPSIPGSVSIPGVGMAGSFDDAAQRRLWESLGKATHMNPNAPVVFFCAGARCWESYNAALRALNLGFKTVLWYRGGLASWTAAGGRLAQAGGDLNGRPPQPPLGFAPQTPDD